MLALTSAPTLAVIRTLHAIVGFWSHEPKDATGGYEAALK